MEDRQDVNRWYVGALMGIGRDMELTLFGVFLMKTVDSDHLKGMLKVFFRMVENKPQVIVTQNNYYYDQALL